LGLDRPGWRFQPLSRLLADEKSGSSKATSRLELSLDGCYTAPECFNQIPTLKSDIFLFGLILCELLSGETGFSPDLAPPQLMSQINLNKTRPHIPDSLCDDMKQLIADCWKRKLDDRSLFVEMLSRLDGMDFQIVGM
jgi:hypothetical protein